MTTLIPLDFQPVAFTADLIRRGDRREIPRYDGTGRNYIVVAFRYNGDPYYAVECTRLSLSGKQRFATQFAVYPGEHPTGWAYDPMFYIDTLDVYPAKIVG